MDTDDAEKDYLFIVAREKCMFFNWTLHRWQKVNSTGNISRGNMVTLNNRIFVCTGKESESYSPITDSWTPVVGIPWALSTRKRSIFARTPTPIDAHSACQMDGLVHFLFDNQVCVYNPIDKKVKMEVLSAKQNGGLLSSVNNRLILTGGTESSHIRQPTNTAWMYIDQIQSWTQMEPMKRARWKHASVEYEGILYVCGGIWCENREATSSAECYDPQTNEWTMLEPMPNARYGHSMVEMGGLLWAVGGFSMQNRSVDTVDVYDPFAREWDCPFMKVPFPILGAAILRLSDDLKADLVAKSKREI